MSETLVRQWEMLRLIPRAPRKIATSRIEEILSENGFAVNRRTVQRDLQYLSATFPLTVDDRHKPYGWSWMKDAAPFDVPGLDLHAALAFRMASDHLDRLLPAATRERLEPHFEAAREKLDALEGNVLRTWPDKVATIASGPSRQPPVILPEVLEAVQEGLFLERRLKIDYCKRGGDPCKPKRYRVNPLGLVYRDAVAYLVCALWNYEDVVQLAIHRMTEVIVSDEAIRAPEGFSLAAYVASEAFGFVRGDKAISLRARFQRSAAINLLEAPVADDQRVIAEDDHWVEVVATVADTTALRTWLLGYGAMAEVLEPASLRDELATQARAMVARYGGS